MSTTPPAPSPAHHTPGFLGLLERLGNALPDPIILFLICALVVVLASAIGDAAGWAVQPVKPVVATEKIANPDGTTTTRPIRGDDGRPQIHLINSGEPIRPRSLLTSDSVYWAVANMVRNFINFPPLGIVLVGVLGIGVAEKVGLFAALMKWIAGVVPSRLLTPTVVFLGLLSHVASDAGYIVLPPLAAGLFAMYGRSPIAGIAAAFVGIGGGFSANLLLAPSDAIMAPLTERAARVLEPSYSVLPTCNWWFMAASVVPLTLAGWGVTAWLVEPRFRNRPPELGGPALPGAAPSGARLSSRERRALTLAMLSLVLAAGAFASAILVPGAPLHGPMPAPALPYGPISAEPQDWPSAPLPRWSQAIVPILFVLFVVPGIVYGTLVGEIRRASDAAKAFQHGMHSMAPVLAVAFFAAQFLEYFKYSRLDTMLAFAGGKALVQADLPPAVLVVGVVFMTMCLDLMISSMSAKWTILSPILVPMLMMAGVSPELAQLAYRVGDSVTNVITPLNAYLIVILMVVQRSWKAAGLGSLIALMVPYCLVFSLLWTLLIVLWLQLGIPPGPNGATLHYVPAHP